MEKEDLTNNPEFMALQDVQGIDEKSLMEQAGLEVETPADPPEVVPPVDETPPEVTPPEPTTDPASDQRGDLLKEIFGDRFKTVEEAKNANISGVFDEVDTLKQAKTELETKLSEKPKTNFANDEVALYNEFVRETGVQDFGVFSRLKNSDLDTMDPMEALVTKYIFDHPEQASKEPQIRKHFEKKYNVDPEQVDDEELAINKIGMEADGSSAKKSLEEAKAKIKMPEPQADTTPKELTPEEKTALQNGWQNVGANVSKSLAQLKVPIKNGKEPLMSYEISEDEQKEIQDFVKGYAVENRMELNETNVKAISTMVYNQLMLNKLPEIVHSVFEKARGMTEDQVHATFVNPSPAKNTDAPPAKPNENLTDAEKQEQEIFDAEMGRYNI